MTHETSIVGISKKNGELKYQRFTVDYSQLADLIAQLRKAKDDDPRPIRSVDLIINMSDGTIKEVTLVDIWANLCDLETNDDRNS